MLGYGAGMLTSASLALVRSAHLPVVTALELAARGAHREVARNAVVCADPNVVEALLGCEGVLAASPGHPVNHFGSVLVNHVSGDGAGALLDHLFERSVDRLGGTTGDAVRCSVCVQPRSMFTPPGVWSVTWPSYHRGTCQNGPVVLTHSLLPPAPRMVCLMRWRPRRLC